MISAMINGKFCKTINDFYSARVSRIKYSETTQPISSINNFYDEFLVKGKRLPAIEVVEAWHDLLIWYIYKSGADTYFIRKYEGGGTKGAWNNRRGAIIRFNDGFEIVYSSNFLAHEIYLMAYHGFVPDKNDFLSMVKNRTLRITSGTEVEKKISVYPAANKPLLYCYLAHIMDVNGRYLRDDGSYGEITNTEQERMYPRGTAENWLESEDRIWHISGTLSSEEKELVKAHCLRFLDPMNYYLTPLTKQCTHSVKGLRKNIGEYPCLTYYVQNEYKRMYKARYDELIGKGRFIEQQPDGYTGYEVINLEYSSKRKLSPKKANTSPVSGAASRLKIKNKAAKTQNRTVSHKVDIVLKPADEEVFKDAFIRKGFAKITITYIDGKTETRIWKHHHLNAKSRVIGNIKTQYWYKSNKESIEKVVCEVN